MTPNEILSGLRSHLSYLLSLRGGGGGGSVMPPRVLASGAITLKNANAAMLEIATKFGPVSAQVLISVYMQARVCSDEGLTLETSAKHHIPQVTNIPYQPLLIKPIFNVLAHTE